MKNNTTHRPMQDIVNELLNHPDLVRAEWIHKDFVKERYEDYCDDNDIEDIDFDKFWEDNGSKIKENSYEMFTFYGTGYIQSFLEDIFAK